MPPLRRDLICNDYNKACMCTNYQCDSFEHDNGNRHSFSVECDEYDDCGDNSDEEDLEYDYVVQSPT